MDSPASRSRSTTPPLVARAAPLRCAAPSAHPASPHSRATRERATASRAQRRGPEQNELARVIYKYIQCDLLVFRHHTPQPDKHVTDRLSSPSIILQPTSAFPPVGLPRSVAVHACVVYRAGCACVLSCGGVRVHNVRTGHSHARPRAAATVEALHFQSDAPLVTSICVSARWRRPYLHTAEPQYALSQRW